MTAWQINYMEDVFSYLENVTGVQNLSEKDWEEVVDEVILPKLAGTPNHRYRIGSPFMAFMAKFSEVCWHKNYQLGLVLNEIALQRISNGAVLHKDDPTPTFEALPAKYHPYASANGYVGCEPGLMGKDEEDFLIYALRDCVSLGKLKAHVLAICFGLAENITLDGEARNGYMLGTCDYKPNGVALRELADDIIQARATPEQAFKHWAKPDRWREHKVYFAKALKGGTFEWQTFWSAIAPKNLHWWRRWSEKRKLHRELEGLAW